MSLLLNGVTVVNYSQYDILVSLKRGTTPVTHMIKSGSSGSNIYGYVVSVALQGVVGSAGSFIYVGLPAGLYGRINFEHNIATGQSALGGYPLTNSGFSQIAVSDITETGTVTYIRAFEEVPDEVASHFVAKTKPK